MVTKRINYLAETVEAARSVMIELTRMLGEYREGIVIVGGWVPELLFGHAEHPHTGSLDVDLALDHRALGEVGLSIDFADSKITRLSSGRTALHLLSHRAYQRQSL